MASRSTRGARGGSTDLGVSADMDVKAILEQLKAVDPALARSLRRRLRQSADEAIAVMREVLAQPASGVVSKRHYKLGLDSRGRTRRVVSRVDARAGAGRSRGSRANTSSKLRVAVRTGAKPSTQGVRLTGDGGAFSRSYNLLRWRHPVRFNPATQTKSQVPWVEQAGTRYWSLGLGADDNFKRIRANVEAALADAQEAIERG